MLTLEVENEAKPWNPFQAEQNGNPITEVG